MKVNGFISKIRIAGRARWQIPDRLHGVPSTVTAPTTAGVGCGLTGGNPPRSQRYPIHLSITSHLAGSTQHLRVRKHHADTPVALYPIFPFVDTFSCAREQPRACVRTCVHACACASSV